MVNITTEFNPRAIYVGDEGENRGIYSKFSYELYVELDPDDRASMWWGAGSSYVTCLLACAMSDNQ